MRFYEVLYSCSEEPLTEEFLSLCSDSLDLQKTRSSFLKFLENIKKMQPIFSDEWVLFMTGKKEIYAKCPHSHDKYGIMKASWKEVLGWNIQPESLARHGKTTFTAGVLWDLTFFGFDEETVQRRSKGYDE